MAIRFPRTLVAVVLAVWGGALAGTLHAQTAPELISATPAGLAPAVVPPFELYGPGQTNISGDNRWVVFSSTASDLVPGDTNGVQDVFLRDRLTGTTTLVSRASGAGGAIGNGHSGQPVISADGRFVSYVSAAANLAPGDTNAATGTGYDVFVRDLQAQTTTRVSVSTGGAEAPDGVAAERPAISADGRYIAFSSTSSNLAPGGFDLFNFDVYLRDTQTGTTTLVSVLPGGGEIIGSDAVSPSISGDGRRVAFTVYDNTLGGPTPQVPPNLPHGVYVRDLVSVQTILVSARPDGTPATLLVSDFPMISADGRFVSFASWEDLDPAAPDTIEEQQLDGPFADIFVRDLATATTRRASMPFPGGPAEESGRISSISADGRTVAYTNTAEMMVVRDLLTNTSVVLRPNGVSPSPFGFTLSRDGRLAYFESFDDLVPGDTNGNIDAYVMPVPPRGGADLSLTLTASPTQPAQGGTVTFTVAVSNAGGEDAGGVTVAFPLPAGLSYASDTGGGAYAGGTWTVGALSAGSTASLQVVATATSFTAVTVTAEIATSSPFDPDSTPGNGVAAEDDQKSVTITPQAIDLALSLNANTLAPFVNANVTLTVSVGNTGTVAATGVSARLLLPAGLTFVSSSGAATYDQVTGVLTFGTVPNGGGRTHQVVARVATASPLDLTAEVLTANETDRDSTPGNGVAGEDDQASIRLLPVDAGIVVNDTTGVVNANDGKCTLVEAIIAANTDLPSGNAVGECAGGNGADVIHLRAVSPPYVLTAVHNVTNGANGLPPIRSDITIEAGGQTIQRSTAPGTPKFRIFHVGSDGALTLDDAVVINGAATEPGGVTILGKSGGAVVNVGSLTVLGGRIAGSTAECDGGGIYSQGPVYAAGTVVENNQAGCSGGGLGTFYAGVVTLNGVAVRNNTAVNGGGLYIHGTTAGTLIASSVTANTASGEGGGIFTHNADANLAITSTIVNGNVATSAHGGGISNGSLFNSGLPRVSGGTMSLTNSLVVSNRAAVIGGGIASAGPLTITGGEISTNRLVGAGAYCGGGIYAVRDLSLANVRVAFNAAHAGGGVCSTASSTSILGGELRSNTATTGGGLIAFRLDSDPAARLVQVSGTQVAGNTATASGGGIYFLGVSAVAPALDRLVLDGVTLQQNTATGGDGGGLYALRGTVEIRNATRVSGNVAGNAGGGIVTIQDTSAVCCDGPFTMTGGTISGNTANGTLATVGGGGGIAHFAARGASAMTLTGVTISGNHVPLGGNGGGIFNRGVLNVLSGTITGNDAQSGGGLANGTSNATAGTVTLTDTVVSGNAASGLGGGLFAASPSGTPPATTTMTRGALRNNQATDGGGAFLRPNARLDLDTVVVDGNTATGFGGAINTSGTVTARDVTFSSNAAAGGGGAFLVTGPTQVTGSTFSGNSARNGAALLAFSSTTDVVNSTFSGNVATTAGAGAIETSTAAGLPLTRVTLTSSTVVDNVGVPGALRNGGDLRVQQSIIAGNRRPDGTPSECDVAPGVPAGSSYLFDNNLVSRDVGCALFSTSSNQRLVEVADVFTRVVGPLADNGGPTRTHALLPGSLAIDAAFNPITGCAVDQRGSNRPVDGDGDGTASCDIGAVEMQSVTPVPVPVLSLLSPGWSNAAPPFLYAVGSGFTAGSTVLWNGSPRTSFAFSPTVLQFVPLPTDVVPPGVEIATAFVTVRSAQGAVSNPQPFTMLGPAGSYGESVLVPPGSSASASSNGVAATLTHNGGSAPGAVLTVADYRTNPTTGTIVAAGGFFDVQITGADPTDVADVRFYYPSTVTGTAEAALQLTYWTGTAWAPVISAGGAVPVKNTTDNLDGTMSTGGRFAVTFDATSTPSITALGGTVFAIAATGPVVTPRVSLVGGGVLLPDGRSQPASVTVLGSGPASPRGLVFYRDERVRLTFASTSLTAFTVNGGVVTLEGTGSVNGRPGFAFVARADADRPDTFGLAIKRPDGTLLFALPPRAFLVGGFSIVPIPDR